MQYALTMNVIPANFRTGDMALAIWILFPEWLKIGSCYDLSQE
jgi:hypothetical protein